MALVQFFGIGAPRSGTSWIAQCIDEHPELAIPIKETHFFERDIEYVQGTETFERRIRAAWDGEGVVGEFCPNYLGWDGVARRLYEYNPDARLVAILRNPIDRAFSHFLLEVRAGQASLERGIIDESIHRHEYLSHGYYARHLRRLDRAGFDQNQLLVLFFEELREAPEAHIKQIWEHLGVEDVDFRPPSLERRVNASRVPRSRWVEGVLDVADRALQSPRVSTARELLRRTGLPRAVRRLNSGTSAKPELSAGDRELIRRCFERDVEELTQRIGRPPPWSDFQSRVE